MVGTAEMSDGEIIDPVAGRILDQKKIAERLFVQAKKQDVGLEGLFNQLTKSVVETALDAELTEHLGREHGRTALAGNMRKGTRGRLFSLRSGLWKSRPDRIVMGRSSR